MSEAGGHKQTDDHSKAVHGSGSITEVKLVGFDKPFFTALAIAISIVSAFYSFEAGRETAQSVYWLQRSESFLEQLAAQGVKVPPDLLQHKSRGE